MNSKTHSISQLLIAVLVFLSPNLFAQQPVDPAIEKIINDQVTAWNKGDATAYSSHFAKNGTFTNIQGMFYVGYDSFYVRHDFIFRTFFKGTTLQMNIVSERNVAPDVVVVETLAWVANFPGPTPPWIHLDAKGRLVTRLLQVLVKQGANWEIVSYHNVDVKPNMPVPEPKL